MIGTRTSERPVGSPQLRIVMRVLPPARCSSSPSGMDARHDHVISGSERDDFVGIFQAAS